MQRGLIGYPFPTGKNPVNPGTVSAGLTTNQANGAMKASVIVFDTTPGTRNIVIPTGVRKIRAASIGAGSFGAITQSAAGGGYSEIILDVIPGQTFSYTVGAGGTSGTPNGGTTSFGGLISATGGVTGGAGGTATGGSLNYAGGAGSSSLGGGFFGGASSGHRYGTGQASVSGSGSGWMQVGTRASGGSAGVDGFGLGFIPGQGGLALSGSTPGNSGGYGSGGGQSGTGAGGDGGLGGGAAASTGACGGGGGALGGTGPNGGNGGVLIEVIG